MPTAQNRCRGYLGPWHKPVPWLPKIHPFDPGRCPQLAVAVGMLVTQHPPHRSVRALVSAYGSSLGCERPKGRTPTSPWDTRAPHCVGCVLGMWGFSLCRSLPSLFSAGDLPPLFEEFIGTMPQCDSSQAYMRAVRP